jgi:putative hemolysin
MTALQLSQQTFNENVVKPRKNIARRFYFLPYACGINRPPFGIKKSGDFFKSMSIVQSQAFSSSGSRVSAFDFAPAREFRESLYTVRFARCEAEVDAALRLRFEVFNLELNEGLEASFINGRDEDEFDKTCHHLIVIENASGKIVGTYRVRTMEMARSAFGFYSASEFAVEDLPYEVLTESIETGRACIAREHRNSRVLFLLWKGLAMYMAQMRKRYVFGCCSLPTQDCAEGLRAMRRLVRDGFLHASLRVAPREDRLCRAEDFLREDENEAVKLPKLFETYLRIGAKICGEPVIDRQFKTIDFFVIVDVKEMRGKYYQMFFG